MKKNYILLGILILFNICIFSKSYSQVIDTVSPVIFFSRDEIEDFLPSDCNVSQEGDTIRIGLTCVYSFPTDYLNIASPSITDETDPAPKVDTVTTIDSIKREVVRYWIVTDFAGNISNYMEIIYYNGVEYQLNLNSIEINKTITVVDIDPSDIFNQFRKDSIYFCNDSVLNFTIDSDWDCNKYKKEFNWKVNGKLAYSEERYSYSLSLDTLPAAFEVIVEANEINNNFDNQINFTILHLPKTKTIIVNPTCNGSSNGSISVSGPQSIKWENNSTDLFRQGLAVGKYWYTYSNDSCSRTDTIVLVPDKELNFTISSDIIDLSQQNYITITNTSSLAGPYIWQVGDSVFSNNKNEFDFFLSKAGDYSIILSVGGADCTDKVTQAFTVTGVLPPVSWVSSNPTCMGSSDGSIQVSGTIPILWEDQTDSKLRQNLDFGKYWFSYTDSAGFQTDTVHLIQDNYLDFSLSDDQIDLAQESHFDITNTSTLEGSYQWLIGDTTFINNDQEFEFKVKKAGNLDVILSLANSTCLDSVTKTVSVTGQLPTGLDEDNSGKIEILPTLVHDHFQLNISVDGKYSARIFDLQGIEVYHTSGITSGKSIIPVGKLSAGTYIIKVFKATKMVYNQKFIKLD